MTLKTKHLLLFYIANIFIRLIALLELRGFADFYAPTPAMDTDFYYFLSELIRLKSPLIESEPYFYFPIFGWYMHGINTLFGDNPYAPRIITIILGSSVPIGLYLSAKEIFKDKRLPLVALFLGSFYDMFVFYDNQVLKTSFEIFFITWGLYLILKNRFLASGLLFGLSSGVHTPVALPVLGLALRLFLKKEFKNAVLFIIPTIIVLGSMTLRNYIVSGHLTAVDVGGIHLYTGNNPNATGIYEAIPGIRSNAFLYIDAKRIAEKESGRKGISPSSYFGSKAIKWIKENPSKFLALTIKKIALALNRYEIPNNLDIGYIKERTIFLRYFTLPFWILGTLGLSGLIVLVRDRRLRDYGVFFALYGVSVIMFFVSDRYRLPLAIPLIIYATGFFEYILRADLIKQKIFYAITFIVCLIFVNLNLGIPKERFLLGTTLKMNASDEVFRIKKSINIVKDPKAVSAFYMRLGELYLRAGGWEQGRYYYFKAFKTDPSNEQAELTYYKLGVMGIRPVIKEE